jgi:hypothetical protein
MEMVGQRMTDSQTVRDWSHSAFTFGMVLLVRVKESDGFPNSTTLVLQFLTITWQREHSTIFLKTAYAEVVSDETYKMRIND